MAELGHAFPDIGTRLVPSSGGVFLVTVNGATVFSKKAEGRHAAPGEIVERIRALRG